MDLSHVPRVESPGSTQPTMGLFSASNQDRGGRDRQHPHTCMSGGKGSGTHSGNATPTSPRISIFTFQVCSILLFLLTSGLLQSWRPPPGACSTGPCRHLEPLGSQPERPRVGNSVWVRAAALSSRPSYLGNSLWPNSSAKNQEPNENRPRVTAKAKRSAPCLQGLSNAGLSEP